MESVCDKSIESGDSSSPFSGENNEAEANGHTTSTKSAWKAKREDWIKPENSSKAGEDSVMSPDISVSAAKDSHRIILDDDHDNVNGVNSPERKKSLPPIKVPEKSAEIPVIVSRAVYNR